MKTVVVGAGPVGALAALYAAVRGHEVEIYELRPGQFQCLNIPGLSDMIAKTFEIHRLHR